jgi:Uma2 family endonuclease
VWSTWVPELVIEVVSASSRHRDDEEKPEESIRFGVSEYWIIDHHKREMLALRRHGGRWMRKVVHEQDVYETKLLPGLRFELSPVFEAADQERR